MKYLLLTMFFFGFTKSFASDCKTTLANFNYPTGEVIVLVADIKVSDLTVDTADLILWREVFSFLDRNVTSVYVIPTTATPLPEKIVLMAPVESLKAFSEQPRVLTCSELSLPASIVLIKNKLIAGIVWNIVNNPSDTLDVVVTLADFSNKLKAALDANPGMPYAEIKKIVSAEYTDVFNHLDDMVRAGKISGYDFIFISGAVVLQIKGEDLVSVLELPLTANVYPNE